MDFRPAFVNLHLQRRDPDHYTGMARPTAASCEHTPPSSPHTKCSSADQNPTATTITLTSLKTKSDVRTVNLELWAPQLVGRASRTKSKNLEAAEDNILFNCPVISRRHAEIELQRSGGREQVVIRDTGSTHGTRLNGVPLEKDGSRTIRQGDVIQLGEKVTRGEGMPYDNDTHMDTTETHSLMSTDAHDDIVLLVGLDEPPRSQESHTLKESQTSRGFAAPTYTDDEEDSEFPSEDEVSEASQHEEASSAKTTPEQRKAGPGTPEQPINVDELAPRKVQVINLVEDTDDERRISQSPAVPRSPLVTAPVDQTSNRLSGEGLLTVVPETLDVNTKPVTSICAGVSFGAEDHQLVESDVEDQDYEDNDFLNYDDIRSDISFYDDESLRSTSDAGEDEDDDDDDGPETYSSKQPREPSPELGTPGDFAKSTRRHLDPMNVGHTHHTRDHDRSSSQLSYAPDIDRSSGNQRYFDPIRSAQIYNDFYTAPEVHESRGLHSTRQRPYVSLAGYSTFAGQDEHNTDELFKCSSRWDVPPPSIASYEPMHPSGLEPTFAPSSVNFDSEGAYYRPFSPVWVPDPEPTYEPRPYMYDTPLEPIAVPRWPAHFSPLEGQTSFAGAGPATGTTSQISVKKPTHIADLIEPGPSVTHESHETAVTPSKIVTIELPTSSSAGKKRKADEMLQEHLHRQSLEVEAGTTAGSEAPQDEAADRAQEAQVPTDTANPPPAKRTRVGDVATIAGKAAVGLAAGGVATIAFLCSPLAERAIEWLA